MLGDPGRRAYIVPEVLKGALILTLLRIEDTRHMRQCRFAGALRSISSFDRMLRVKTSREDHDECFFWQTRSEEIIERERPAAILPEMENPLSREELWAAGRVATHETLLVAVLVGNALWI